MLKLQTPLLKETREKLKAGETLLLTGKIYTARDAAHKRLMDVIARGEKLPFDLENQLIYYVGPTPKRPDGRVGSAGPTTSSRMDPYTPSMFDYFHIAGMIGKGDRSLEVIEALKKHKGVYLIGTGGAGALLAKAIQTMNPIMYEDLGPEAIHEAYVVDFPVVVGIDCQGNNLYKTGPQEYRKV